jgi:hypothetical protein
MSGKVALFSFGTLQLAEVQRATFGRLLDGCPDTLLGYVLAPLEISDPEVVRLSGKPVHSIARRTGDPSDLIPGVVLLIDEAELRRCDAYEVDAYAPVEALLASGTHAFVYVGPDAAEAPSRTQPGAD